MARAGTRWGCGAAWNQTHNARESDGQARHSTSGARKVIVRCSARHTITFLTARERRSGHHRKKLLTLPCQSVLISTRRRSRSSDLTRRSSCACHVWRLCMAKKRAARRVKRKVRRAKRRVKRVVRRAVRKRVRRARVRKRVVKRRVKRAVRRKVRGAAAAGTVRRAVRRKVRRKVRRVRRKVVAAAPMM